MKKEFLILICIIVLASFLRLWQLGNVPPSPDWDEAALGWNAYSIMQTGRDEYGKLFPIVLRSFDDYKPALYAYLAIPTVAIFGVNTFAVRLPSAVMGILTVVAVYFLVKELFTNPFLKLKIPTITALLLAVSPWHLQFSRIAFEANVGLSLNIFAVLFFLWGLKKPGLLSVSALMAALSLYVYQSEKIFTPLLVLALLIIFREELAKVKRKYLGMALTVGLVISLPLVIYTITDPMALTRARGVSAFADQTVFLKTTSQKIILDKQNNDYLGLILDNRRLQYVLAGINGYLSHFDLNWLFLKGDEARHHAPGMGLLYLFELPFVLMGIYQLLFGNFPRKAKFLVFSWFLIAPVPASITSGVPHAIRTLNFLPTWQVFSAVGIISLISQISPIWRKTIFFFLFSFLIFNFIYYLNQYFVQQNYFQSQSWQYGYKEAVNYVKNIEDKYDKIIVSNVPHLDQSYMFFLFYQKYDSVKYQAETTYLSGGCVEKHYFGKYEFRPIEWKEQKRSETLFVGKPGDFPPETKILKRINFLDGKPAIEIVEG